MRESVSGNKVGTFMSFGKSIFSTDKATRSFFPCKLMKRPRACLMYSPNIRSYWRNGYEMPLDYIEDVTEYRDLEPRRGLSLS